MRNRTRNPFVDDTVQDSLGNLIIPGDLAVGIRVYRGKVNFTQGIYLGYFYDPSMHPDHQITNYRLLVKNVNKPYRIFTDTSEKYSWKAQGNYSDGKYRKTHWVDDIRDRHVAFRRIIGISGLQSIAKDSLVV